MRKKQPFVMRTALALFMVLCSVWGWGQYTVNFDGADDDTSTSSYGFTNHSLNGITWSGANSIIPTIPLSGDWYVGVSSLRLRGYTGTHFTMTQNKPNGIGTVTFEYRRYGTDTQQAYKVEYSTDNGNTWTQLGVDFTAPANDNVSTFSETLNMDNARIRIIGGSGSSNRRTNIDNLVITDNMPACQTSNLAFTNTSVSQDFSAATYTQTATSLNGTTAIAYSSSDMGVATVDANTGEVTFVTAGTTTITATQAEGDHNGTLYCAETVTYDLTITSSAPSLSVSGTADNGAACLNTAASVQTYTITNAGNSAAAGLTVVSDNVQFVVSNISATTVAGSNGTVTFDVTFTPTSAGAQNATITVESSTSGSNVATIDLTGTGTASADPVLSASAATAITDNGATLNGEITSLGTCLSNPLTEKGFVYGTSVNPEFSGGIFIANGTPAAGVFDATVTTLSPATTYYYKAYVVDGSGQYYFSTNEETFTTTLSAPIATTATNITPAGFTANWNAVTGADGYILEVSEVTGAPMTDLIISEYVEGSGSNKAIEIYNGTSASVDLSNYTIIQFNNGASRTTGTRYALPLSGNLASGATYVIVNQSALQSIKDIADLVTNNSVLNFNGDDALAIYNSSDVTGTSISTSATEIDIFGVIGDDPGSAWTGAGGYTTVDKTLRRKATVSGGVTLNPSGTGANAFTTLTAEWDLFNIDTVDDLGSHTANTVIQTLLSTQNVGNVLTFDITGLDPNSNYTYTVKAVKGTVISADSNTISVTTGAAPASTTYTGGSWTNGAPNSPNTDAVISENYAGAGFTAKDITVQTGAALTIPNGQAITAANMIVEDDANLIQEDGSTLSLSGTLTVNKNASSAANKYVFWSSPVQNQNVYDIYPAGTSQFVMTYDSDTDLYPTVADPTIAAQGIGYSVKVPSGATAAQFTGTPNSGDVTVTLDDTDNANGNTWNLIGNPYPSNLNLQSLYSAGTNGIDSSIYFWDNITATNTTQQQAATTWAVFNAANGTWSAIGAAGLGIDGNNNLVKPGQGFIVRATAPSITFTNAMRTAAAANFINKGMNPGEGKFWLKLTTPAGAQFQTAITYGGGALNTFEAFDSKVMSVGANGIYSYLGTEKLAIQGRDYFVDTDVVIIGNKHSASGQYTFSLAGKTGLFDAGQAIYLKDKQTNMYTNLQTDSYTFTADALEQQDRFEIVYQPQAALGTSEMVKAELAVYKEGDHFTVKASEKILSIEVYDAAGRHIGVVKPNSTTAQVAVGSKGMYLLKIKTVTHETVKKVIK